MGTKVQPSMVMDHSYLLPSANMPHTEDLVSVGKRCIAGPRIRIDHPARTVGERWGTTVVEENDRSPSWLVVAHTLSSLSCARRMHEDRNLRIFRCPWKHAAGSVVLGN